MLQQIHQLQSQNSYFTWHLSCKNRNFAVAPSVKKQQNVVEQGEVVDKGPRKNKKARAAADAYTDDVSWQA